jgi:hypothetical protein
MNKQTKNILIVAGITVFLVGGTYLAYKIYQNNNKPKNDDEGKDDPKTEVNPEANKGKFAHIKGEYVNVRKSPEVNNGLINNLLKKETESPIGVVLRQDKGKDGYTWYKLRLAKPVGYINEGYVREDVITLKN